MMPGLFEQIRGAVADERVIISRHAAHRPRDRHIPAWQAVTGIAQGQMLRTRPRDKPNPVLQTSNILCFPMMSCCGCQRDGVLTQGEGQAGDVDEMAKHGEVHIRRSP